MMTALQMATASFAVPKSVMKTMVGRVFGFLAVSRRVPKPRQPVNENVNNTARKAIPSRLERMLLPRDVFNQCVMGRLDARPIPFWRIGSTCTPERFNEIAPAGNLRDYNPGIEIQSRRWKRNGRGLSRTRIQVYARCDGATGGLKGWLDNKLKFASRFSLSGMTASHSRVGPPRCLSHLVG